MYINKFFTLILVFFLVGIGYLFSGQRPNIVIIVCDDLNDSIEGMGGHPQAITPNINRLIESGVRFTNAASNSPICGPSRASLWTGLHPVNTGMYGGDQQRNRWHNNENIKDKKTLFETLIDGGYRSFATGKIFHNGHEKDSIYINKNGDSGYGSRPNFGPYPNDGESDIKTKRQGVLPPWWSAEKRQMGSRPYDGFGPVQDVKVYGENWKWTMAYYGDTWEYREGYNRDLMPDEVHAKEAKEFLEMEFDSPYLLTIGFSRPHSPWYAPKEFFDMFPLEDIELAPNLKNDLNDCAKILHNSKDLAQPWGFSKYQRYINMSKGEKDMLKEWTQAYLACVAFVDAQVGKVLDAIEKRSDANNTLIIFTSDHGYHMGEKDYIFKLTPWEESVRIPFVVVGPKINSGKTCDHPISLVDLFPTCIDYASVKPSHDLDGYSLRSLLEDADRGKWAGPNSSLSVIGSRKKVELNIPASYKDQHLSLRSKSYRYILCSNGEEELYDHTIDPNEWNNLINESSYKSVIFSMRKELKTSLDKLLK